MLEKLKYKNHLNEVIDFGSEGIYVNTSDLHNYEWFTSQKGNRISSFDYGIQTRTLNAVIVCNTEAEGIAARNRLLEVAEKDILAKEHGKIILGNYYYRCFVTKSQKSNFLINKRYMTVILTLKSDFPFWVKENTFVFRKLEDTETEGGLDFGFDFPFDFTSDSGAGEMINPSFANSNFRLIIYGYCSNPSIYIGGHKYEISCDIADGEYLTVDSIKKTITLTAIDGTVTNKFKCRDKESYIFEKIKPGINTVNWTGSYGVDIILIDERSEPKWT